MIYSTPENTTLVTLHLYDYVNLKYFLCRHVQARTAYSLQLHFGPYTIQAWTTQSVNLHIALKAIFYLLSILVLISTGHRNVIVLASI